MGRQFERRHDRTHPAILLTIVMLVLLFLAGPAGGPLAPASAQNQSTYVLASGDTVEVVVFGEADLSRSVVVRPDGKISLPLIGEIQAAGSTPPQLAERIAEALKTYLRAPQVSVTVTAMRRMFVQVVGQAARPGAVEIQQGWTLLDVLGAAGGLTPRADPLRATITRKESVFKVDLDRLLVKGDKSANVPVEPDDIITIPTLQNRVVVLGQVTRQGPFDLEAGARLMDALAAAGGIEMGAAATNRIGIIRLGPDNKPQVVHQIDLRRILRGDASQNIVLQHADVVYVPRSGIVLWREIISWITGYSVIRTMWPGLALP
ncbi:MAG: polysaccharide biosynthesis/export family protein [Armatimonadota bacterium]|nr:polysaccharide biosynthesis/export family protein [Armatimonadota bacterium]